MQQTNRVVLMLSGGSLLFGIASGVLSLGWDEWQAVRKRAEWAESRVRANLGNASAFGLGKRAEGVALGELPKVTPLVPPDDKAPRFEILTFDALTAGRYFFPVSLNNRGEVLGGIITHPRDHTYKQVAMQAAVFRADHMVPLPPLPGYSCLWPMAMNNQGQAVCVAYDPMQTQPQNYVVSSDMPTSGMPQNRVVLCSTTGTKDLHIVEQMSNQGIGRHPFASIYRTRIGINDLGQITLHVESLYWWSKGTIHLAGTRMAQTSPLLALCNSGVLVRPAVRAVGTSTMTGLDANSIPMVWYDVATQQETPIEASDVWDMNDKGEVLCSDVFPTDTRLRQFRIIDRKGQNRVVASVRYFGGSFLNDSGQVVGLGARLVAQPDRPRPMMELRAAQHGPFWCGDGRLYDLNDLIPANSGWTILQVRDFNNRGEVLVYADRGDGKPHSLLLRPIASPPQRVAEAKVTKSRVPVPRPASRAR